MWESFGLNFRGIADAHRKVGYDGLCARREWVEVEVMI